MKVKSRLHLYPSKDIKERAYIAGDRTALLALSDALRKAANGAFGMETLTVYADNGHDYDIFITSDISETEWQNLPKNPSDIQSVKNYDEIRNAIQKERAY